MEKRGKGGFINFTTQDGLASDLVSSIHSDADGVLWFGTWGGGVSRYDGKEFVNFTTKDGLANDRVSVIQRGPDGALWIGTWRGGVSRYDGKEFVNFTTKNGLAHNAISTIYCDLNGALWFGTWGGGVSQFDGKGFVNFTTKDGLASNHIWSIYRDSSGILWVGTDGGGVSGYDGIAWTSLDTRDGLSGNCVAIQEGVDGCLWFGTEGGLTCYRRSRTSPKARIVAVTTDRRYTDLDSLEPITAGTRITFEYSSIDFKTHPDKRLYQYKLNGYDADWSQPTNASQVDYVNLPIGKYIFQVQAIDRDLNYSEPATLPLTIQPDLRDIELVSLQTEIRNLRWEVGRKYHFENIVGRSAAMKQVYAQM